MVLRSIICILKATPRALVVRRDFNRSHCNGLPRIRPVSRKPTSVPNSNKSSDALSKHTFQLLIFSSHYSVSYLLFTKGIPQRPYPPSPLLVSDHPSSSEKSHTEHDQFLFLLGHRLKPILTQSCLRLLSVAHDHTKTSGPTSASNPDEGPRLAPSVSCC